MPDIKRGFKILSSTRLQVTGFLILMSLAVLLLWFNNANSNLAVGATAAQLRFQGEYRIGDGPWQEIRAGQHIPATKGDVTLKGNFHLYAPFSKTEEYIGIYADTVPVAFFTDHINLTFYESGFEPFTIDRENPAYGSFACGMDWSAYTLKGDGTTPIEIVVHNPHKFGNETAIDRMLAGIALWGNIDFEKSIMEKGDFQQKAGIILIITAFVMLGSALFSALLKIKNSGISWILGVIILAAGFYLIFSAWGINFWSENITTNTVLLNVSIMFYMLFVSALSAYFLENTKAVGHIATVTMGVTIGIFLILPMVTDIYFYDLLLPWVSMQSVANIVLIICLIKEYMESKRWMNIGMAMLLFAFEADAVATATGYWKGGYLSQYVFSILFIIALVFVLRIIPENANIAARAKELELQHSRLEAEKNIMEAQLKDSRISIMLSQIQPHFIYNTLGTIERMCLKDPQKAFELVRNFSLYLRGNFSELDSVTPIRFTQELKHVEYYANIEKVRFPDMNIEYDVKTTDFVLPALSVQPLVENAIKHGLMRLESGGTVLIRSYETDSHFCVEVKDDGLGFDPSQPLDDKKHVGLRNIRGRLNAMVDGQLVIESEIGKGTKAVIMIPKEVTE